MIRKSGNLLLGAKGKPVAGAWGAKEARMSARTFGTVLCWLASALAGGCIWDLDPVTTGPGGAGGGGSGGAGGEGASGPGGSAGEAGEGGQGAQGAQGAQGGEGGQGGQGGQGGEGP